MRTAFWTVILLLVLAPAQAQNGNSNPFATQDPLARALQQNDFFVGKSLRSNVDANALAALTKQSASDRPLKIAVFSGSLPKSGKNFGNGEAYTKALHDYLNLKRGLLLLVTPRKMWAATDALSRQQINQILQEHTQAIQQNPTAGIVQTVQALDALSGGQADAPTGNPQTAPNLNVNAPDSPLPGPNTGIFLWIIPLGIIVVAVILLIRSAASKSKALQGARLPIERLHNDVVTGISYADTYLDLLPASEPATMARQARQDAAQLLEQSAIVLRNGQTVENYGRAQALLEQAQAKIQHCRQNIDAATGGTGVAVAVEGTDYKATPVSATGSPTTASAPILPNLRAEDIPEAERAACFFCSRPARITDLTPVTIAINGQKRKVLACPEDVQIVKNGVMPSVRTVEESGRRVPWYSARQYDPYRDYGRFQPVYVPVYAGYGPYAYDYGVADGFLLGSLMSPPYPAPYPVFVDNGGSYTSDPNDSYVAPPDNGLENVGSADFFGNGNNDSSSNDTGDFGGSPDFNSDSSSDNGSSWDNSTSDAGSADFGSVDTSSSDFGGSSDFGSSDSGSSDF